MAPTVQLRPSRFHVLFVVSLALAGCGVAGYEKQMQDAEVRVQRFDEENKLLGAPLDVPAPLPKAPAISVFLRPPKGVAPTAVKDEIPYHYPATAGVCSGVYLTINEDQDKAEKAIEERFGVVGLTWQPVEVDPPGRAPIAFKAVEFFDREAPTVVYVAYVHQTPGLPAVGVVFHLLKTNHDAAMSSWKMSMETYAEQGDANKARADFGKRGKAR